MTKVIFHRREGVFYGFDEQGHTGYGESGDDVLCAALSAMSMLIINTCEVGYAADVDYHIDEETTNIRLTVMQALPEYCQDEKVRFAVAGLLTGYYYQLNDLTEEYYDYLSVEVVDD